MAGFREDRSEMATYTTNLNLKKPADSDTYDIDDFNGNSDIIDTAVGNLRDSVSSTQNGFIYNGEWSGMQAKNGNSMARLVLNDDGAITLYRSTDGGANWNWVRSL